MLMLCVFNQVFLQKPFFENKYEILINPTNLLIISTLELIQQCEPIKLTYNELSLAN